MKHTTAISLITCWVLAAVVAFAAPADELSRAVLAHDQAALKLLTAEGRNLEAPDDQGLPPLLQAADTGFTEGVLLLLGKGAKVDACDPAGRTALMLAARGGFAATATALLEAGANPQAKDRSGKDAVGYARSGKDPGTMLGILSAYGAEIPAKERVRGYARERGDKFVSIPVYYATNRRREAGAERVSFSGELDKRLHYGVCTVSIPDIHLPGELESPAIFRIELSADPQKHVVLQKTVELGEREFYRSMQKDAGKKEVLIFIHGYNVGFEKAARRTAQIVHDLNFTGVPLLISWPSSGSLFGYGDDAAKVNQSIPAIEQVISGVVARFKPDRIHVIAHSMGTYGLTKALVRLSDSTARKKPIFNQLILAAPDIDAEVFKRQIAPKISPLASRVSLYGSSNDLAMTVSRQYNEGRRAGDSDPEIVVASGIDSIDVSRVDASLIGHSYYGSNRSVITDIHSVLLKKKPQERDFLDRRKSTVASSLASWFFNPFKKPARP